MTYQERSITASLVSFVLILGFYLIRVIQLYQQGNWSSSDLFMLWGIVIVLGIVVTIISIILSHIASAIIQSIQTGGEEPKIDDIEDERDKLIDLRGTRVAYIASSIGVFLAMLSFAFQQEALLMFALLILSGLVAQILGDISRLYLYRRGF
jgi:hypothetical protein